MSHSVPLLRAKEVAPSVAASSSQVYVYQPCDDDTEHRRPAWLKHLHRSLGEHKQRTMQSLSRGVIATTDERVRTATAKGQGGLALFTRLICLFAQTTLLCNAGRSAKTHTQAGNQKDKEFGSRKKRKEGLGKSDPARQTPEPRNCGHHYGSLADKFQRTPEP